MSQKNLSSTDFRSAAILFLLLATGSAGAIGLGDLVLESRLGQPLQAHIPVTHSGRDEIDTTCLHPKMSTAGDQLPRLARVHLALEYTNGQPRVVVNSAGAANDVAFLLGVQIGCGYNFDRDYVVLLDPPEDAPTGAHAVKPVAEKKPAPADLVTLGQTLSKRTGHRENTWEVHEGESLLTLAEKHYPGNVLMQNRMIAATLLKNLAAFPDGISRPIPPGTRLSLPDPQKIATTPLSRFQAAIRHAMRKTGGARDTTPPSRPVFRIQVTGGTQGEAKRGISTELDKQRLLMESDDSSATHLSLQRRIEEAESHLAQLKVLEQKIDQQLAELKIAASRPPAPAPKPASDNPISEQTGLIGGIVVIAGMATMLFLRRGKSRSRGKTSGASRELTKGNFT